MKYISFSWFMIIIVGCNSSSNSNSDSTTILTSDLLTGRVNVKDDVLSISGTNGSLTLSETYVLTLIGEADPPLLDGLALQATDVYTDGALGYVSYNYVGSTQKGAIEIFDIADEAEPSSKSLLLFRTADINAISILNDSIYAVGATSENEEIPAFLKIVNTSEGVLQSGIKSINLPSYAGNDVEVTSNFIYASSGSDGGVKIFDTDTLDESASIKLERSTAVGIDSSEDVYILSSQNGEIHKYRNDGNKVDDSFLVGGATIAESKFMIDVGEETVLVALGDGGFSIVCKSDWGLLHNEPQRSISGVDELLSVTNAASLRSGLLFTADGEAGVSMYTVKTTAGTTGNCTNRTVVLQGTVDFGSNFSANHVFYDNGYLFVADGLGGLKIVTVENNGSDNNDDDDQDSDGKQKVCHKGNKTLTIPPSAVKAHLGHGDTLGECS